MKYLTIPSRAIAALLLTAAFVLSRPYAGIRHDGILYLGEALLQVDPQRMADDLFFLFGSQASFSVFPEIYGKLIGWIGIGEGTIALLAGSLALYWLATFFLLKAVVPAEAFVYSALLLFIGAPIYGGHRVFAYGEAFLTARSLAEPLVLFAMALLVRQRVSWAIVLVGAALGVHPLIALPGLVLIWVWLVIGDRRWLWAASLGVLPVALAAAGVAPFDGLFRRYDADWMAVVQVANPFVFPMNWMASDWATVVFDVVVLVWTFIAFRTVLLGRLAQAAVITGVLGIVGSLLAADAMSNVLLTGLQLWRTHWLMHWCGMVFLPPLAMALWTRESNDRAAALLLVASAFSLASFGPLVLAPAAVLLVVFRRRLPVTPDLVLPLILFCAALACVTLGRQVVALSLLLPELRGSWLLQLGRVFSITVVLVLVVVAGIRYLPRRPLAGVVASAGFLIMALFVWDQREQWTLYQENFVVERGLLWSDLVGATDRVYWFREIRAPWLMMRHANYYSPNQSSGVLFNRRTALALAERSKIMALLDFQETICRAMNNLNKKETSCEPDIEVVKEICSSADRLSFVVLQSVLTVKPVAALRTGIVEFGYEKVFYLYRCADIASR